MTSQSQPPAGPNAAGPQPPTTVELMISRLLRAGVSLSFCVIALGTVISFGHHPDYFSSHQALSTLASPKATFPRTTSEVLQGILHLQGKAIVIAGLFLLIATPVMRVAVSIVAFAIDRDWMFVAITTLVLALLVLSFFLGGVEG
jgi:uncharacterized membrane protein